MSKKVTNSVTEGVTNIAKNQGVSSKHETRIMINCKKSDGMVMNGACV